LADGNEHVIKRVREHKEHQQVLAPFHPFAQIKYHSFYPPKSFCVSKNCFVSMC
jgi:hypothetical protein